MSQIELKDKLEGYVIRDLVPEDYEAWHKIYSKYDPEGSTPDQMRKRREEWDWSDPRIELTTVEPAGRTVGFGRMWHRSHQADGAFYLSIDVDPEFLGRGIGTTLIQRLEEYANQHEAKLFTAFVRDGHDRSRLFMERNGYPLERDLFESTLDFENFDWTPFESMKPEHRDDITIITWRKLGDTPENRTRLYESAAKSDTAPDMEIWGMPDQAQFEKDTFGSRWFTPDCLLIAVSEGQWVGHHLSGPIEPGSDQWTTDYTGVIPEFRGRGIGMALKLRSIEIAIAAGAKSTMTHNDSENKWMLEINRKLGFVKQPGWLQMRKRI